MRRWSAAVGHVAPLMFAASLPDVPDAPDVRVGDVVSVDESLLALVLAAIEHAGAGRRDVWERHPSR